MEDREDRKSAQPQEMTWQVLVDHLGAWRDALTETSLTLQDALFEIESRHGEIIQKAAQEVLKKAER